MSIEKMIKNARVGNLVRFQRNFVDAVKEKIPQIVHNERKKMADKLFHPNKK